MMPVGPGTIKGLTGLNRPAIKSAVVQSRQSAGQFVANNSCADGPAVSALQNVWKVA